MHYFLCLAQLIPPSGHEVLFKSVLFADKIHRNLLTKIFMKIISVSEAKKKCLDIIFWKVKTFTNRMTVITDVLTSTMEEWVC